MQKRKKMLIDRVNELENKHKMILDNRIEFWKKSFLNLDRTFLNNKQVLFYSPYSHHAYSLNDDFKNYICKKENLVEEIYYKKVFFKTIKYKKAHPILVSLNMIEIEDGSVEVRYYNNKSIKKISYMDGKKNGYYEVFSYENQSEGRDYGIVISRELYVNDRKEGISRYYYEDDNEAVFNAGKTWVEIVRPELEIEY